MASFSKLFGGGGASKKQLAEVKGLYQAAEHQGLTGYRQALGQQRRAYSTLRAGAAAADEAIAAGRSRALDVGTLGPDTRRTQEDVDAMYRKLQLRMSPEIARQLAQGRMNVANAAAAGGRFGAQSAQAYGNLLASVEEEDPAAWFDAVLTGVGTVVGMYYGGPAGAAAGYKIGDTLGGG